MANPTNTTATFNLPPSTAAIVDVLTGAPTPAFYFLLLTIQTRTGGVTGLDLTSVNATANAALALGHTNSAAIVSLQGELATQGAILSAVQITANTAEAAAAQAIALVNNVRATSLQRANNLSDLTNPSAARGNIGLATIGALFAFPTPAASQVVSFPVIRPMSIPANFSGTVTFAETVGAFDAVFTVQLIRSGATIGIGTINLIHGGQFNAFTAQPLFPLNIGDVLQLVAPASADPTLAGVAINLALNIS